MTDVTYIYISNGTIFLFVIRYLQLSESSPLWVLNVTEILVCNCLHGDGFGQNQCLFLGVFPDSSRYMVRVLKGNS